MWTHFRNLVSWATQEQWMGMRNNWELFPGAVAVIDGTRHEIQWPQTEPQQQFKHRKLSISQLFYTTNNEQQR